MLSSNSLCQFHWLAEILIEDLGKLKKKSCKHNKYTLGKAIVIKIKIGRIVQNCSNISESNEITLKGLVKIKSLINLTTKIIINNQTITKSWKLSKNLEISEKKDWKLHLAQNDILSMKLEASIALLS